MIISRRVEVRDEKTDNKTDVVFDDEGCTLGYVWIKVGSESAVVRKSSLYDATICVTQGT